MWRLETEQKITERLVAELKDAKEYGSIINLSLTMDDVASLRNRLTEIDEKSHDGNLVDIMETATIYESLIPLVEIAEVLLQKYNVAVTNPPYMAVSNASIKVQNYVKKYFPDSKSDLFAVFIERCRMLLKKNGYQAMITQHAWMFLSSFEKLRAKLQTIDTVSMAHLGARAFDEINGEVVQTTSFVVRNSHLPDYLGKYQRLIDGMNEADKAAMFCDGTHCYTAKQSNFSKIPGSPVAYWVEEKVFDIFGNPRLTNFAKAIEGIKTGENDTFLRYWFEVDSNGIALLTDYNADLHSWCFTTKGGAFRKWYGNIEYIMNWINNGYEVINFNRSSFYKKEFFTQHAITWTYLTSGMMSFRYLGDGYFYNNKGPAVFSDSIEIELYLLALLNTNVGNYIQNFLNPTLTILPGNINSIPVIVTENNDVKERIISLAKKSVDLSRTDWDAFETSWDFTCHPLVHGEKTVQAAFGAWKNECDERFNALKQNEEELNRIFIDIYGLQDELTPEVEDKDVTVRKADLEREIRSLISYAVGCMFGRYSLDMPGLAYAGVEWDAEKYKSFIPDKDNIIPICDDDYFDDDITGRFVKWVETAFGRETLEENLKFIAGALGGKGTPRQVIRNYFLNDFYADHLKTYQKRPVYWLFDSGKKNGFKALIYMHRYQSDTIARLRTDYVHEQQERYRTQLKHIGDAMDSASASERVKLAKQQKSSKSKRLNYRSLRKKYTIWQT